MKEIIYNITQQTEGRRVAITGVSEPVNKSNVLGIINKTQSKVLYTPLQYANLISSEWASLDGGTLTLTLADNVQIINVGDELFVKLYLDKDIDFSALAQETTLTQGIADLKDAFANIDLSSLETTLVSGLNEVKDAVNNIDFTDLENSIAEVKNAVANIDFSALAKESTLTQVQSKVDEVGNKIDNIKPPEIDTTKLAKEETLETQGSKIDRILDIVDEKYATQIDEISALL